MKTYDVSYLEFGVWREAEQVEAPSRRQAMRKLRVNDAYLHTIVREKGLNAKGVMEYRIGGNLHGRFRVRLAA